MADFYNPFTFGTQTPTYNTGYYSSAPAQPGVYGPNQFGIGYTSNQPPFNIGNTYDTTPTESPSPQGLNFNNALGGITAGLAAGSSTPINADDYSIDPFAGYKGSGAGFAAGGPLGAIVGGATAQFRNFSRINKNLKNLSTDVRGYATGPDGRPIYLGGNVANAVDTQKKLTEGANSILKPKSFVDPINPVLSGLFGTRRKLREKSERLRLGIIGAQTGYNKAAEAYSQRMQADAAWRNSQMELFNNNLSLPQQYSPLF